MGFDFDRLISVVLDSIAPNLLKYDMIFLIGEAGAGKTTIMNILRGKGFNEKLMQQILARFPDLF